MSSSGAEAEPVCGVSVQDDAAVGGRVVVVVAVVVADSVEHLLQNPWRRHVIRHQRGQQGRDR